MAVAFFVLILLLFSLAAHAGIGAQDPSWRALLHFPPGRGGVSSANPRSDFFLSKDGYRDPAKELAATLRYFDESPDEAACRFPARALFLRRAAGTSGTLCERWAKWRDAIRAKGAELVFASAFLSSPSSMYGHVLLKFLREGRGEGEDLLDYTLNYGADTGNVVGVPYVWMGLTGGFQGSYATAPFYLKVREYNFVENRDFWIYPLNLDADQLRLLVAHAWEIRDVPFPYFFLHRNCAFYLLEFLELARPGAGLTSHFPFWTVPLDTIRLLQREGLAGTPRFRASRYRRLVAARDSLQPTERSLAEALAESGDTPLPRGREAAILDAAYELWRYRNESKSSANPEIERLLLDQRAQYAERAAPAPAATDRPESGHPTSRAYVGGGRNRLRGFVEVGYRGTLHDLLADPAGYEDFSELSMGDLRLRLEAGSLFLERFDLLRLRAIAPREPWIPRWSWSFRAGFERAREFTCEGWGCSAGNFEGGYGVAAKLGPVNGFVLLEGGMDAGRPFERGYRLGIGPSGGIYAPLWPGARALLEGTWRWRVAGSETARRSARAGFAQTISRAWEARLTGESARGYREALAQANFYF
jgi:hypothetical protein